MENFELITNQQKAAFLAKLEASIASGAEFMSYEGNNVKFRGLDDMLRIRDNLRRELGLKNLRPRPRARRIIVARF